MKPLHSHKLFQLLLIAVLCPAATLADDAFKDIEIKTSQVGDGVYMLTGKGGNLGVSIGEDGVFLIDDQFAPLTDKIYAAIKKLSDKPLRFVLNTHWHPDHTGGNENIGKTGAVIVAHDNVRKRLSVDGFIELFNMQAPALDSSGLPVVTFNDSVTFHLNDEEIVATHAANAHTDGDSFIYFRNANVLHAGDIYFAGMYPFIDTASGGSVEGYIRAIDAMLELINDKTVIIPGHGPVSNKENYTAWRNMLAVISNRIKTMKTKNATLENIKASMPTADYEKQYGNGFISGETFIEMVYNDL